MSWFRRLSARPNRAPAASSVADANPIPTSPACTSGSTNRIARATAEATAGMRKPEAVLSWTGTPGSGASHTATEIASSDAGHAITLRNQPTSVATTPLKSAAMSPAALIAPAAVISHQRPRRPAGSISAPSRVRPASSRSPTG